ncbi:MarR family winged helix-turn-helix transcriptional regulator [Actinomadura rupiterrae]|uniref:MarR family winged helix-turn-helix transcriptional regulator n=1 Tax=Actinomadura rupiterrae TaxID=559627 RepID=UPI0020A5D8BD|nr:MarR family winged helix-turn-helix transcriptional regulator [Actinomadura rupiterrae]MCP2341503.1 DNA-binding MarR family transcriptional regulator [Actinomadura rupiterrae]
MSSEVSEELTSRLGYLLKSAYRRLYEVNAAALAPHGIDSRSLAVLRVLAAKGPMSQLQGSRLLGIDRTSMVELLDALEGRDLVTRHPDPADRRRNIVDVTDEGRAMLAHADLDADAAEREFLTPLSADKIQTLKELLQALVLQDSSPNGDGGRSQHPPEKAASGEAGA